MGKMVLVVLAVVVMAFSGLAYGQPADQPVGYVAGPADREFQEEVVPEMAPSTLTVPAPPQAATGAPGCDELPLGHSRDDMQKASQTVLSGEGHVRFASVEADEGHFRTLYVGGKKLGLDDRGRVVGIGTAKTKSKKKAKPASLGTARHRALWKEAHEAGVVSRSFVEARDNRTLDAAMAYTDSRVRRVGILGLIALVVAAVALALGVYRLPRWRTVYAPTY